MRPTSSVLIVMLAMILPGLVPDAARADCATQTFFSCRVENGKQLEVCIDPDAFAGTGGFSYSFGPPGAPELRLQVPMAAGTVTPWNGVGREIWETVGFPNGDYLYEAWHSVERNADNAAAMAGVNVLRGTDLVARLTCVGRPDAQFFVLVDAMAAAGWCWDIATQRWGRGICP